VLTLFIVNADPISPVTARERVQTALEARAVIEQAKGVLAEQEALSMEDAYLRLREMGQDSGQSLSEVAKRVILGAHAHGNPRER
jgi:AmiR/NasT family two-component response regulator